MQLQERDYLIMNEIERFRYCLGRHIKELCGFEGQRACDRRMKILGDAGYITRKKVLYGYPGLYTVTHKGKVLIGANKRQGKIRLEQIYHDVAVLDTACFLIKKAIATSSQITTDKELHSIDGFGMRSHKPDFIFTANGKLTAVEVEMTRKNQDRFSKNVKENYLTYDSQVWVVPKRETAIIKLLSNWKLQYSNITILEYEVIKDSI